MLWQMTASEWFVSFGFISCITYIVGWLTDVLLKSAGFGPLGNWIVLLIGTYGAMYGFNHYGYDFNWYPLFTLTVISSVTFGIFMTACVCKRALD